ncbi:SMP-30/gluconolactonase/LRE family protein [Marinomonas sp. 2405UD68-3]|uniref:SMP-30/gluconolactonase/LRE family protein n=1 Tax=Marinomonas sp. 2405UD68-3 TaxID=3391835 RepID=UPI0039C9CAD5
MSIIEQYDLRVKDVFLTNESLERISRSGIWNEGPVWLPNTQTLLWSDIPNDRIVSWNANRGESVWRSPANFTNGHYLDRDGNLLHCSHSGRCILKTDLTTGDITTLVDRYNDKPLNSPNDLVVKSDGSIWFTDPPYGILSDFEGYKADSEQAGNFVYCYSPETQALTLVCDQMEGPNGLAFSLDETQLYVSDTSITLPEKKVGHHHIMRYDVQVNSMGEYTLTNGCVFANIHPGVSDGFRLDKNGWIYTSSQDSIQIYHPDGALMAKILVPEQVSNCTFGGDLGNVLFITASTSVYKITLNTQGANVESA